MAQQDIQQTTLDLRIFSQEMRKFATAQSLVTRDIYSLSNAFDSLQKNIKKVDKSVEDHAKSTNELIKIQKQQLSLEKQKIKLAEDYKKLKAAVTELKNEFKTSANITKADYVTKQKVHAQQLNSIRQNQKEINNEMKLVVPEVVKTVTGVSNNLNTMSASINSVASSISLFNKHILSNISDINLSDQVSINTAPINNLLTSLSDLTNVVKSYIPVIESQTTSQSRLIGFTEQLTQHIISSTTAHSTLLPVLSSFDNAVSNITPAITKLFNEVNNGSENITETNNTIQLLRNEILNNLLPSIVLLGNNISTISNELDFSNLSSEISSLTSMFNTLPENIVGTNNTIQLLRNEILNNLLPSIVLLGSNISTISNELDFSNLSSEIVQLTANIKENQLSFSELRDNIKNEITRVFDDLKRVTSNINTSAAELTTGLQNELIPAVSNTATKINEFGNVANSSISVFDLVRQQIINELIPSFGNLRALIGENTTGLQVLDDTIKRIVTRLELGDISIENSTRLRDLENASIQSAISSLSVLQQSAGSGSPVLEFSELRKQINDNVLPILEEITIWSGNVVTGLTEFVDELHKSTAALNLQDSSIKKSIKLRQSENAAIESVRDRLHELSSSVGSSPSIGSSSQLAAEVAKLISTMQQSPSPSPLPSPPAQPRGIFGFVDNSGHVQQARDRVHQLEFEAARVNQNNLSESARKNQEDQIRLERERLRFIEDREHYLRLHREADTRHAAGDITAEERDRIQANHRNRVQTISRNIETINRELAQVRNNTAAAGNGLHSAFLNILTVLKTVWDSYSKFASSALQASVASAGVIEQVGANFDTSLSSWMVRLAATGVQSARALAILADNRQIVNALGGMVNTIKTVEGATKDTLWMYSSQEEALKANTHLLTEFATKGILPNIQSLQAYNNDMVDISMQTGLSATSINAMIDSISNESSSLAILKNAREGEREAILANQRALLKSNIALGMTATQATEASKMLNKMAGEKPLDRLKTAAKMRVMGAALGLGPEAELAARAHIKGKNKSASDTQNMLDFMTKATGMIDKSAAAGLPQELFMTTLVDKLDMNQYYGESSPFSLTLANVVAHPIEQIRDMYQSSKDSVMKNLDYYTNILGRLYDVARDGTLLWALVISGLTKMDMESRQVSDTIIRGFNNLPLFLEEFTNVISDVVLDSYTTVSRWLSDTFADPLLTFTTRLSAFLMDFGATVHNWIEYTKHPFDESKRNIQPTDHVKNLDVRFAKEHQDLIEQRKKEDQDLAYNRAVRDDAYHNKIQDAGVLAPVSAKKTYTEDDIFQAAKANIYNKVGLPVPVKQQAYINPPISTNIPGNTSALPRQDQSVDQQYKDQKYKNDNMASQSRQTDVLSQQTTKIDEQLSLMYKSNAYLKSIAESSNSLVDLSEKQLAMTSMNEANKTNYANKLKLTDSKFSAAYATAN